MSSPESISRIVTKFDRLRQLTAQAERLNTLNAAVLSCLPAGLSRHARIATMRDGCLVLQADSPAWAAELRYKTPEILAALAAIPEFASIRSIRVKNRVSSEPAAAPRIERPVISQQSARSITAHAAHVKDERLRAALLRLASRAIT
jgi:hypothetical protein